MISHKYRPSFKKYIPILMLLCVWFSLPVQAIVPLKKAKLGDSTAQLELGNLFFYGDEHTPQAYPRAISWYRKALKNGNKTAAFNLAICYDAPYGVERNLIKAQELYLIAIEAGVKPALLNYALIQTELNNPKVAKRYLLLAANEGVPSASRIYALTFKDGPVRLTYLKKASELGDSIAMLFLADYHEERNQLDQMILYLEKSSTAGSLEAMVKLGFCFKTAYGVSANGSKARALYKSAAEQGNALATVEFGKILLKEGRAKLAFKYFSYASKMNHPIGLFMKGVCFNSGLGIVKNETTAFVLFEKSAKLGYVKAQYNTGLAFEQGTGITASLTMAKYWYEKAVEQHDIESYLSLAEFYFYGADSIKMDKSKSIRYLRQAEKLGSPEATKMLKMYKSTLK